MKNPKLIAFFLPQFHRISENDRWWGNGFTEWTNVKKTIPRFSGHHQPHIPVNSNYYDLSDQNVLIEQAKLAQEHGISGFCFYHYWFNGHKLLERPIEMMLESSKPDFPFMLCWANENWTRRWDGQDAEILIAQSYDMHDFEAHAKYLAAFMLDERYIKIDERPVLAIYRADHLPDLKIFLQKIRESLKKAGVKDLSLLAMSRSAAIDSFLLKSGIDQIIDFRPDQKNAEKESMWRKIFRIASQYLTGERGLVFSSFFPKLAYSFRFNYDSYVNKSINQKLSDRHIPCVFPTWDNSARRKHHATIIQNNNPEMYQHWLENSILRIQNRPGEQVVFINAWNEWAEGCHLEPDTVNGDSFLKATSIAIRNK